MTTLMVQGTTSDAGKSTLVTALCRWLARQGVAVAPFKPQNMALNSAVTADGGEIGRAQAVQAQAAGLPPHTDMNPVLLKPNSDTGAQVIIHGRAVTQMDAAAYHDYKRVAMQAVLESHRRLSERYQVVMVEGAGSPAEINLRTNDIANMGFAEAVDCPVILIADIDKGGVFAHLVGTLELLSASEQARVRGFVINRFRGDIALLQPGLDWLERRTGKPVLGVLPYLMDFHLEAEDAIDVRQSAKAAEVLKVVVPVLPRISNHTDFDPLRLMQAVLESHRRLSERYQVVMVEGAGSPAEINLRTNDIANMGFAEAVGCPVILIADIDKGGVFAHLVGTLELLSASEQARVRGFVINRFRGDIALLQPGLDWLERRTGKPVLGVLPYLMDFHLEAEDAIDVRQSAKAAEVLKVVVPVLPRISNHTDFDPLRLHPQVDLCFVGPGQPVPAADLIVLPGSKSVRADLAWLRANGWEAAIQRHLRYGGKLLGICGGLQMLGQRIADPLGLEGEAGESEGLGLLAFDTMLEADKQLRNVRGRLCLEDAEVSGYEIHAGVSDGPALRQAAVALDDGRRDGAISVDGQVLGTYLHGLFESPAACAALLRWAGLGEVETVDYHALRERDIERLADLVEAHLDVTRLRALCGI